MILNGTSTEPTSTFPYTSVGPIDFSNLNFVRTKQVDYYYGTGSAANQLMATVEQQYDPAIATIAVAVLIIVFFLVLGWFIKIIRRMGR
jgi:hypothetical protein